MILQCKGEKKIESVIHSDPSDLLLAATNAKTRSKVTLVAGFFSRDLLRISELTFPDVISAYL